MPTAAPRKKSSQRAQRPSVPTPTLAPAPAVVTRARITPLPPVFPSPWATAYGEDRHGLWQAFEVAGIRQVMRWIPPGKFQMGSPGSEEGHFDDETQHPVTLTEGFWLADTACTQALWMAVMAGANPSSFKQDPENPTEDVSWNNVVTEFLPRLNAQLPGLDACLPTEAQWEYACRGDAASSTSFWFGNQIHSAQINFYGAAPMPGGARSEYRKRTIPVKALPCGGWGLFQMHGNVLEWCADWIAAYPDGESVDPIGPPDGAERVLRGGSWFLNAHDCRSANRDASVPSYRRDDFGFRLARGAF